jgi:NADH-quinone oxidoreductase subunit M
VTNPKNEKLHDLNWREVVVFVPLIAMALWIGLYPKPFFQILEQPATQIARDVQEKAKGPVVAVSSPSETDEGKSTRGSD